MEEGAGEIDTGPLFHLSLNNRCMGWVHTHDWQEIEADPCWDPEADPCWDPEARDCQLLGLVGKVLVLSLEVPPPPFIPPSPPPPPSFPKASAAMWCPWSSSPSRSEENAIGSHSPLSFTRKPT